MIVKNKLMYFLFSKNKSGHGIQSSFANKLIRNVFNNDFNDPSFYKIEERRNNLKLNKEVIEVNDLGAGSKLYKSNVRRVSDISSSSLTSPKYCRLLYRIVKEYSVENILELGTSFGITTSYLSMCECVDGVTTIEGCSNIASVAFETFKTLGISKVKIIKAPFDEVLPELINKSCKYDLIYFDGNHTYDATMRYFEYGLKMSHKSTILIFDDIYWSEGMKRAWIEIKQHEDVCLTVDIFKFGFVFKSGTVQKENIVVRF